MQLGSLSTDKNKGLIMHQTSRLVKVKSLIHSTVLLGRIGIPEPWENGVLNWWLFIPLYILFYLGRLFFHGRMPRASLCFCSVERRNLKKCEICTGWTARAISSNSNSARRPRRCTAELAPPPRLTGAAFPGGLVSCSITGPGGGTDSWYLVKFALWCFSTS